MRWDDLRFFLAVARTGRLTEASRQLGVDHATVGRRIATLEHQLGARLFDRSPRGYALTDQGQRLMPYAETVESNMLSAADEVAGQLHDLSGVVRIGSPEGVANYLLPPAALDLCRAHPRLELQIVTLARTFSLSQREADFAIMVSRPTSGRLSARRIADYHLHLYAHEDYLARHAPAAEIDDVRGLRLIGYIPDMVFDKELDYVPQISPSLKPTLTSASLLVQLQCALAAGGVAILPDFIARRHRELRKVLPDRARLTRTLWLVQHEDLAGLARIRRVSAHVAEAIREELAEIARG